MISLVVAMTKRGVIGNGGHMPWHEPADLRRFRKVTTGKGKAVVFGRKTFDGIGAALAGRCVTVLTRDPDYFPRPREGCSLGVVRNVSLAELLPSALCAFDEVIVAGGAEVYAQALPLVGRIYLTELDDDLPGDVLFPPWDRSAWHVVSGERVEAGGKVRHAHTFSVLDRKGASQ